MADNLVDYIEHFSPNVRDVFEGFGMLDQIANLAKSDRLYLIVKEFAAVDLHPKVVTGPRHGLHLRRTHPQVRRVQLHPGR